MPFVHIRIVKQVIAADPAGKKARIGKAIADVLSTETGLPKEEVSIVFDEVDAGDWFVGDVTVEALRAGK